MEEMCHRWYPRVSILMNTSSKKPQLKKRILTRDNNMSDKYDESTALIC